MAWEAEACCECCRNVSVCRNFHNGDPPAHAAGQLVLLELQAVLQLKGLLIQQPHAVAALCRRADMKGRINTKSSTRRPGLGSRCGAASLA